MQRRFQEAAAPDNWARPIVLVMGTRAMFTGYGMQLSPHRLAAATLVIALDAPFNLSLLKSGKQVHARMAVIAPDTLHELKTEGRIAFLYLDATSDDYAALGRSDLEGAEHKINRILASLQDEASINTGAILDSICRELDLPQRAPCDSRIVAALRSIDAAPHDFTAIGQAANIAGLSVPRFQHLFKEATGTSFRRYRLWRRMGVVARALAEGQTLTNAALDAGFSSSAHLSAAFRTMFGIKPSQLVTAKARIIA
jgi:AraC-like DNA-binding protein